LIAGIHQPNYLPWLGYFYKIAKCDVFVFLDNVQLPQGRSFVTRNKIKTQKGWDWLTVPCEKKGKSGELISEVQIDRNQDWNNRHRAMITHNYSRAPYFSEYFPVFEKIYGMEWLKISDLNIYIIEAVCEILELTPEFIKASSLETEGVSTKLLISTCKAVGADTYLSGFGGKGYMDEQQFKNEGIKLEYYDFHHPQYNQLWGEFVPALSVIDLILNEGDKSRGILLD